jgi:hypothetical protein
MVHKYVLAQNSIIKIKYIIELCELFGESHIQKGP